MPWKIDLVLMLRSIIGDLDKAKFTDERIKQILVVGAYNVLNDADFSQTYTVDVASKSISPDPISENDTDFSKLKTCHQSTPSHVRPFVSRSTQGRTSTSFSKFQIDDEKT